MLFISWRFAVFLLFVFVVYWLLPDRFRNTVLLFFSLAFYMCGNAKSVILLLFVAGITYCSGIIIERSKTDKAEKICFTVTVLLCMGILFTCKYINFYSKILENIFYALSLPFKPSLAAVIMPLGISFFSLQGIGYVSDVYHRRVKAETNIITYYLFITFFPHISSGPIARAGDLIPQFKNERVFSQEKATYSLSLIIWGMFKKMVVADGFSVYVDRVYSDLRSFSGLTLIAAVLMYSVQIYCDFSGYTDIARGAAGLLGIDLTENFKAPYLACSVKEFWSRWHISLSSWLKDYVYIPLGGNRKGKIRTQINLLIVFIASGIWHGNSITFIIWGLFHAFAEIIENTFKPYPFASILKKTMLRRTVVFIFVSTAWIFFRADTVSDAVYVIGNAFCGIDKPAVFFNNFMQSPMIDGKVFAFVFRLLTGVIPVLCFDLLSEKRDPIEIISNSKNGVRFVIWMGLLIFTFMFKTTENISFVYFQF